jgi:uncharacterized protein YdhG (YjbR/CyaY superfamily)
LSGVGETLRKNIKLSVSVVKRLNIMYVTVTLCLQTYFVARQCIFRCEVTMMNTKNISQQESDFPRAIGNPARNALEVAGYSKIRQLTDITEAELSRLHGMGPKALRILRETLEAKGLSFAGVSSVDLFMEKLEHPLKAEVEELRTLIKKINSDIVEQIKWNAPSYKYRGNYLVTFNLRETNRVHLVFHNPMIPKVKSELLEGDYADRRMTYFSDMQDIKAKKAEFQKALKELMKLNT